MSYVRRQRLSWARIKLSYFWFYIFDEFLHLNIIFFKIFNLWLFNKSSRFSLKNLLFGTLHLGIQNNRLGLFSKGFIVYFSMYFFVSFSQGTSCIILCLFFFVNTFFKNFLIIFFCLFLPVNNLLFSTFFSYFGHKKISNLLLEIHGLDILITNLNLSFL